MTNTPNSRDKQYQQVLNRITTFFNKHIYILFAFITIISLLKIGFFSHQYNDADSYMRLIRIKNWLENPTFFEQPIPQSNYPYGDILHWTRPMDILWLVCSLPFMYVFPLKDALFAGGHLVSPIANIFGVFALIYGLKANFNIWLTILGTFLFLSSPIFQHYYSSTYADHHSLMTTLTIYTFSLTLYWLKTNNHKYLTYIGITLAIATMVAIEGTLLYAIFMSFFICGYLFANTPLRPTTQISLSYALTLTVCWLLNPPYEGWLYPDNGRISVLFVIFSWLICLSLYFAERHFTKSLFQKITILFIEALCIIGILIAIFSIDIFISPLDKTLNDIWIKRIAEMRPFTSLAWFRQLNYYAFPLIALIINIALFKPFPYNKPLILNLYCGLLIFALNLYAMRFNYYLQIFSILPYVYLVKYIYTRAIRKSPPNNHFPISVWNTVFLIFILQQLFTIPLTLRLLSHQQINYFAPVLIQDVKQIGGTLLTDVFLSERYMWEADVNTVGTTYHRNHVGLIDTHNIIHGTNDDEILSLLQKHQVTQLLLFARYDSKYYSLHQENQAKLYYRLHNRENIPSYLTEIESPIKEARHFKVNYNVDFPSNTLESQR